jgi:outer membrane protein assembly factor BamE (lipoprotein component of BamABCDE complex)
MRYRILLLAIVAISCSRPIPKLDNINLNTWKNDRDACKGHRSSMINSIKSQTNKLKGLDEMQIIKILGKPDVNELYKRNQKFFFYYLEPGKPCGNDSIPASRLQVRFNAVGLAKEVMVQ